MNTQIPEDIMTTNDLEIRVLDAASRAAVSSYSPYSKFRVGAAVVCSSGKLYVGANVENACYGLGTCAERVALASAVTSGDRDVIAIGIACIDAPKDAYIGSKMPCGACRQWIMELAPKAQVFILGEDEFFSSESLLPHAFRLSEPGEKFSPSK
jgi:cytidine deaminase